MILRAARSTDAGRVGAILSEFIDKTPWMPRVHTRAEDLAHAGALIARGWVTVAERGDRIEGFAACDGPELNALYVAESARGQGLGAALLQALQGGRDHLTLWTFEANKAAHRFYQRHGFTEVARTDGSANDEKLPDIRFDWHKEKA
ncbi:MAG: GNAT family N-acetyltransferase [Sulfitobacter sp.]|nr:GNAT family N-acetyltransferase [Sulfitobacter sp.]